MVSIMPPHRGMPLSTAMDASFCRSHWTGMNSSGVPLVRTFLAALCPYYTVLCKVSTAREPTAEMSEAVAAWQATLYCPEG